MANGPEDLSWGQWRGTISPGSQAMFLNMYTKVHRYVTGKAIIKLGYVEEVLPFCQPMEDRLPVGYMTADLQKEISVLYTDIDSYVEQMKARWILDGGMDSGWNDYMQNLEKMNVDRYVEIYQQLYDASK